MAEIDRKAAPPERVNRAIDAAATRVLGDGTSGCKMLGVVQSMSRDEVTAVFKLAQARENEGAKVSGSFADLEFSIVPYQPNSGAPEVGAYINLKASPDSDASVNLMYFDSGRKTGGCTNIDVDENGDMTVKQGIPGLK
jgi:hypothetical protein